ncbi:hypothetical protein OSB04_015084 [Centaurea solstitialis]|uniref:PPM-type phosphatase domain-containing protein n=1 Tax=Centaurea solstitialis TaxID=347529 RepID=A0AA38SYB1_9ASTR|nr:hypothetical protein OSB04_015084 [Centaurea solstitialis]
MYEDTKSLFTVLESNVLGAFRLWIRVAENCASNLHQKLLELWEKDYSKDMSNWMLQAVLTKSFQSMDDLVAGKFNEDIGSTAVVILVTQTHLITANCGDSRAVLYRGSEAISLSRDHKHSRIESLGGVVLDYHGPRVFGVLAMSRAIGERSFHPWVIPVSNVQFAERAMDDECVIIATDGLWDIVSSDEAARLATRVLHTRRGKGSTISRRPLISSNNDALFLPSLSLQTVRRGHEKPRMETSIT